MQVSKSLATRHSEQEFSERLHILSDAGASIIHVRTNEIQRATRALRKAILTEGNEYREWNIVKGVCSLSIEDIHNNNPKGDGNPDFAGVLQSIAEMPMDEDSDAYKYFVFSNPQTWMDNNPVVTHLLQHYSHILPGTQIRIVLLTPDTSLPDPLGDIVASLRFEPPGHGELMDYLEGVLDGVDDEVLDVDDDGMSRICNMGAGMTRDAFEMYVSLAIVDNAVGENEEFVTSEHITSGVSDGKTEVVNKNDLLELYPIDDISNVGGMENLKDWVAKRADCYTDEARDFGIEAPKGMVFVGPPGTGKSLTAKAVAGVLGVPLVRLDFGKVFNSLVGKSEERMRIALHMVETMAPCVLFCDEIDKGLGGIGGSGDSGTSSRVLGSFLTWLQDCEAPVFTMVTANNVDGLPPELMRRGRFDAIFSTGFPTREERLEVLKIHLKKRGWNPEDFKDKDMDQVVVASRGYVPAEIESAVKDGLIDAFSNEEDFDMDHVVKALKVMVPISVAFNEKVQLMAAWAKQNATPASKVYEELDDNEKVAQIGEVKRKTRVRPSKKDSAND